MFSELPEMMKSVRLICTWQCIAILKIHGTLRDMVYLLVTEIVASTTRVIDMTTNSVYIYISYISYLTQCDTLLSEC